MRRLTRVVAVALGTVVGVVVIEQVFETALMQWAFKSRNPRVIGWLTWYHKHVTNPVWVRLFAGRSANSALLHHAGRKSGREFVTPLTAHRSRDTIIIPMPYGTKTDWLRNLQASGQGVVELDHRSYSVAEPEVVPVDEVMRLLSPMVARIVRMHKTERALRLQVTASAGEVQHHSAAMIRDSSDSGRARKSTRIGLMWPGCS